MAIGNNSFMVPLNLPEARLVIEYQPDGRLTVYDRWRCRRVVLTPEEWVRQNFVSMLVECKGYTSGRIANEISISLNGTARRCDTVVYDNVMRPLMIVEYKAPDVRISQTVFDQIVRYSMVLRAPYLTVSNGISHYCCHIDYDRQSYAFLDDIPPYSEIV